MTAYLLAGLVLGLSAGFAPRSMLALVLSETLQRGSRAGLQVALSPILTDTSIIVWLILGAFTGGLASSVL